jgi:hypothetical protein
MVQFMAGKRFLVSPSIQTGFVANEASYSMSIGNASPPPPL